MTRRRYVWNNETQTLDEIGLDVELPARVELATGGHYEGLRATDGTRIDTAKRHREYMKANGLAVESDFTRTRAEAPKQRAAEEKRARREAVGRITHSLENRPTRRR